MKKEFRILERKINVFKLSVNNATHYTEHILSPLEWKYLLPLSVTSGEKILKT